MPEGRVKPRCELLPQAAAPSCYHSRRAVRSHCHRELIMSQTRPLKYEMKKDGEQLIHKNYIAWIQNLVTDISNYMTLAGIQ
jgi:hypothetical protein